MGFPLIDKSAGLSPCILIQLQFGLILIPLNNQRAKYAINLIDSKHRYVFYLIILTNHGGVEN